MMEHTFTCPIMVNGVLVAEIDMLAEIEITSTGYRGSRTQPPEAPEWEIDGVYLFNLDPKRLPGGAGRITPADEYFTGQAIAYLETRHEDIIETINSWEY